MFDKEVMLSVECDKLMETYSMRIPAITKQYIEKLTPAEKKILNEKILITISKYLHEADFNPTKYLKEE